jgi:glycosyltransferase involved in cell wall biosynthesis
MTKNDMHPFRLQVQQDFDAFLQKGVPQFPEHETLRMDLHCHDHNSDVPDELWGRILRLPETWLKTEDQIRQVQAAGANALTITNHNNARSCWELLDKGYDVLPAAEFSVAFPEMEISAHVLAYGFNPSQEPALNRLRSDGPKFLDYCREWNLPTVLPHPLFLYHQKKALPMEVYEKLALMFERFEVVNGQRDVLQNLLMATWLQGLNEETLEAWGKKHGIAPHRWCDNPYHKRMTGGSDDHFALFSGATGTRLHVPHLAHKLKTFSHSKLALEAIRTGTMAPYGHVAYDEKLSVAFMDYFCQVALNMEDPGLLRMALHRGDLKDKLGCLAISNAMQELRRHKYTIKFIKVFHDALQGQKPGLLTSLSVSKDYRPLLEDLADIAAARKAPVDKMHGTYLNAIENMFYKMNRLIARRVSERVGTYLDSGEFGQLTPDEVIRHLEVPSHFRALARPASDSPRRKDMAQISVSDLMDQLSFPMLTAGLIAGARFAGSRVIHNDRSTVTAFAEALGQYQAPKRMLWLTDTLFDKNGVSSVLLAALKEVQRRDLPIDFLVCRNDLEPQDHLVVVPSMGDFAIKHFSDQRFHIPNLLDVQRVFQQGAYDRVIASTEFCMGGIALYLQQAFKVPAYMYMHTDWMDYVKRVSQLDTHNLDRIRRLLRALYRQFDGMFVLNTEHSSWLTSPAIGIKKSKVHLTAHWTEEWFQAPEELRTADPQAPVFLFAGRLSEEKGVFELPGILARIQTRYPRATLRIAGSGVAENRLRELLPDAEFLGWVDNKQLPAIYAQADMLLLPSRFDTFGCVITEAMSCGVPVGAFNSKGPRDIVSHGQDGLLAETAEELGDAILGVLDNNGLASMRAAALQKAASYSAENIMDHLLKDAGLSLRQL